MSENRLAEKTSRVFRRDRIDERTGSPLESCNLRNFGQDLQMPVIILAGRTVDGTGMNDVVQRGMAEPVIEPDQCVF